MFLRTVVPLAVSLALAMSLFGCGGGGSPSPAPSPVPPPAPPPAPAPAPPPAPHPGLLYLGARCNSLTADGCNPLQMPLLNDGEEFNPHLLLQAHSDQVHIDRHEHIDSHHTVNFGESIQSISSSNSNEFGIAGKIPYDDIAFSAGAKFKTIAKSMSKYDEINYFGEVYRKYTVETITLSDDAKANITKQVGDAMAALPQSPSTDEEYQSWFSFFNRFGTHYVESVEFGGIMRLNVFLHSTVLTKEKIDKSDWNFNLGATFNQLANIDVSWDDEHTQDKWSKFSNAQFEQQFHSVGGDQTVQNYTKWLSTVKANPAPVKTTLSSIEDLMPRSIEYLSILKKYFEVCPHTDDLGVCNGYGICDFKANSCECDAGGVYKEDDGNCYPKCENDCNSHGDCSKGQCKCHVNDDGFGWYTPEGRSPCSQACGQHTYDAGGESCWVVPGTNDLMGRTSGCQTCWCHSSTGLHDNEMKGDGGTVECTNSLYGCEDDNEVCSCDFCPFSGHCDCFQTITCTHGTQGDCPDIANAKRVDFGGIKPLARPRNKTAKVEVI